MSERILPSLFPAKESISQSEQNCFYKSRINLIRAAREHVNDYVTGEFCRRDCEREYEYRYERQRDRYEHFGNDLAREMNEGFTRINENLTRLTNNLTNMTQVIDSNFHRLSRGQPIEWYFMKC